jgi:hypothetical protein
LFEVPFAGVTEFIFDYYKPKLNRIFSSSEILAASLGKYLPNFERFYEIHFQGKCAQEYPTEISGYVYYTVRHNNPND